MLWVLRPLLPARKLNVPLSPPVLMIPFPPPPPRFPTILRLNHNHTACLHLTDFSSSVAPQIITASIDQMVAIDPSTFFTHLLPLAIVIFSLFGAMHILAGALAAADHRARKRVVDQLTVSADPSLGFKADPSGAWTWALRPQEPLALEVGPIAGGAVALCAVLGIPVCRLHVALPGAPRLPVLSMPPVHCTAWPSMPAGDECRSQSVH